MRNRSEEMKISELFDPLYEEEKTEREKYKRRKKLERKEDE